MAYGKKDLINNISKRANMGSKETAAFLSAFMEEIEDCMQKHETVQLVGFGSFTCKYREPKTGRNPHTGEAMEIAGRHVPKFAFSKAFAEKCKD